MILRQKLLDKYALLWLYVHDQTTSKKEGLVMIGQLYADLEEIENLGVDLTDIGAVWNAAKDHGLSLIHI